MATSILRIRAVMFAAAAIAANASRAADAVPKPATSSQDQAPPASVWRLDSNRSYEHLQSGLACRAQVAGYDRTTALAFDGFGLDVGCNYQKGADDITLYLTRRTAGSLDDAMAEAERELLAGRASVNPKPFSQSATGPGGGAGSTIIYAEDSNLRDGIWIGDLGGWTLEYRVTYPAADDAAIASDRREFGKMIEESAGAQLSLCARGPLPDGEGKPITGHKEVSDTALMSSIIGSAVRISAEDKKSAPEPVWCVESSAAEGQQPMQFWHALRPDGSDANADRMTLMTKGEPPTLNVSVDSMQAIINAESHKPIRWEASIVENGRVMIFGYFDARPPREAVSALVLAIIAGKAKAVGGYSLDGKNISIVAPH